MIMNYEDDSFTIHIHETCINVIFFKLWILIVCLIMSSHVIQQYVNASYDKISALLASLLFMVECFGGIEEPNIFTKKAPFSI